MSEDDKDFDDLIEEHFPYDGPHSRDTVLDAARVISGLVRYLNNATGPGNGQETLQYGPTVYRLLGAISNATQGLDQLLEQVTDALDRVADDLTLYDDRRGDHTGGDTAHMAAALVEEARRTLVAPRQRLDHAWQVTSHLGHDLS